ncbi:tripartite tricarboxylate transporter TctB family protein [Salipiger sp.]|uniref:tripartite tricarboxylate transporter TctB family protein n=1 Tax=Salipiger sp. TaxID=2078585 RepID=UPI003A9882D8
MTRARDLGAALALIVIYVFGIIHIGFFTASFVYLMVHMWQLGFRKPLGMVAVSAGVLAVLYGVIELFLNVPMPAGLLI